MTNVLKINNLSKTYGRIQAVNDLSFAIEKGSVFALLGPNGSGKTTTLATTLNVVRATSGTFDWFEGGDIVRHKERIGAILEHPVFYPYLSAEKNLKIVADIKNAPYERIDEVLNYVGLGERKAYPFSSFSLGMKQRLAIASALLTDPEVLVLDEPTNGLDPQGIAEVRTLIKRVASDGKTIIMASHLLDEVQKVCTHVAVLQNGKALFSGQVEELFQNKADKVFKVAADDLDLLYHKLDMMKEVTKLKRNEDHILVKLPADFENLELNKRLINEGIVLNHFSEKKRSLEKEILDLLKLNS